MLEDKKRIIMSMIGLLLILSCGLIYTNGYQDVLVFEDKVITVGVFSDSYWDVQNGYSYQILEDAIDKFETMYPDIRVEYVSGILKEDYSEWLSEQMVMESAPDVFFVLSEDFSTFGEAGALKDLSSFVEQDEKFQKERFYSSAYECGSYSGIQYALPYECAPNLMFVNKSILDREGLLIPDEEWTWEDFYEICVKVTKDTDGNGTIDQFGVVGYEWQDAFESNGIRLFNEQGTECYLADDNIETALVFLEKLERLSSGYNATTKDFDLGNVVFQPMSFSEYRAYKPYPLSIKKYASFEWGCIPMPAGPNGDNISTLDTLLIAMNEKTSNAKYAWEFMKILTCDVQIQSEIFKYSEGVSVLSDVTESKETSSHLMENVGVGNRLNLEILGDVIENAVVIPQFRNYDDAMIEVDKAVDSIIEGNSNLSMEQIIWNRKINSYLKNKE